MKKFYISTAIAFVLLIHLVSLFAMADSYTFSHTADSELFNRSDVAAMEDKIVNSTSSNESGSDLFSGNLGKHSIASKLYYTPIR